MPKRVFFFFCCFVNSTMVCFALGLSLISSVAPYVLPGVPWSVSATLSKRAPVAARSVVLCREGLGGRVPLESDVESDVEFYYQTSGWATEPDFTIQGLRRNLRYEV